VAKGFTPGAPRHSLRANLFSQASYFTTTPMVRAIAVNVGEGDIINIPEKS
jgi:hypothetical protein